jgi:hypothetical protein
MSRSLLGAKSDSWLRAITISDCPNRVMMHPYLALLGKPIGCPVECFFLRFMAISG